MNRRSFHRMLRLLAAAALILTVAATVHTSAPAHAANERVTLSTPTQRRIVLGQPTVLTVKAQADSLVNGYITISTGSGSGQRRPIELPGGTAKELTIVVPPLVFDGDRYMVELVDTSGTTLASAALVPTLDPGDSVVGVFPSLAPDMPESKQHPIGVTAYLFKFDPSQFEFGIAGPAGYDVLTATPDDLAKLDETALALLNTWLATGGRLVVDGTPDEAAAAGLPTEWQPPALSSGTVRGVPRQGIGNGEVMFAAGSISTGDWSLAVAPVGARSSSAAGEMGGFGMWNMQVCCDSLSTSLAGLTNSSVLGSGTLAIAIGLYAVLVGPLLFFLFRRRRSRIWVAAPLLALVATAGVWVLGRVQRSNITDARGTIVSVAPVGTSEIAYGLQFASKSGDQDLQLPAGFIAYESLIDTAMPLTLDAEPTGNVISQSTPSGSFAFYAGAGSAARFDNGIVATASRDRKKIVGTVHNNLDFTLEDVAVFWADNAINVGDIDPGAQVEFTVAPVDQTQPDLVQIGSPAVYAWPDAVTEQQREWNGFPLDEQSDTEYNPDTAVSFPLWTEYLSTRSTAGADSDAFIVAGWTREPLSPLGNSSDGRDAVGTTLLATTQKVSEGSAEGSSAAGSVKPIFSEPGNDVERFSINTTLRISVAATPDSEVVLTRPAGNGPLEVFIDGEWVKLPQARTPVRIPTSAADSTGALYVRTELFPESEIPTLPSIDTATPKDKTVALADALDGSTS